MDSTCFHCLFTVGVHGKNPHYLVSAFPCFFGCPHFCGNPPTSGMTPLLLWLCGHPSLLQVAPVSACAPPLLWSYPHVYECPYLCGHPDTAGSAYLNVYCHWDGQGFREMQTCSCEITSRPVLCPRCWCPRFPTISVSHFQTGSWLCCFDSVAVKVAGHLPSIPASQSQWKKIPSVLRSKW